MDKLRTIKEAADEVGAKDWQVRRAVRRGLIPFFTPFSSRKLVRLSDVLVAIETSKNGGQS